MKHSAAIISSGAVFSMLALALGGDASEAPAANASDDYLLHCSACHLLDGAGVPGVVPTLHELAPLLRTAEGRRYLVRVPGVAQAPLSDARIARLLDWVLLTFSGAAPAPPYEAAEVGALRASPLRDPGSVRRALPASTHVTDPRDAAR